MRLNSDPSGFIYAWDDCKSQPTWILRYLQQADFCLALLVGKKTICVHAQQISFILIDVEQYWARLVESCSFHRRLFNHFVVKSFQEVVVMLSSLIVLAESFKHDCTLKEFNFNGNYILRFPMDKNGKRSSTSIAGWVCYFAITDLTRVVLHFFSHTFLSLIYIVNILHYIT